MMRKVFKGVLFARRSFKRGTSTTYGWFSLFERTHRDGSSLSNPQTVFVQFAWYNHRLFVWLDTMDFSVRPCLFPIEVEDY